MREARGMSQEELAQKMHIEKYKLSKIEKIKNFIFTTNQELILIAKALECRIEFIFILKEEASLFFCKENNKLEKSDIYSCLPKKPLDGWLCEMRTSLKISQAQLAKKLNITVNKMAIIEKNESNEKCFHNAILLKRIVKALGGRFEAVLIPEGDLKILIEANSDNFK